MFAIISTVVVFGIIAGLATVSVRSIRGQRRSTVTPITMVTNPLKAFATAYFLDTAAQGFAFLTTLATFVASFVAFLTHRSKSTTATAIMALTSLLTSATILLELQTSDLQGLAQHLMEKETLAITVEDTAVFEAVGRLAMTVAIALAGSYGTKKSLSEILAAWPGQLGRAKSSTKAIWDSVKEVYYAFHPDMTEARNLELVAKNVKRLTELSGLKTRKFIARTAQQEMKTLITETDEICRILPRSDAADHLKRRFAAEHGRIVSRQTEQRAIIELTSNVRRLPVFISFRGPPGHGKSYTLGNLHRDLSKWMQEEGHLDRPMDRLVGTGGGDQYLPPIGNQEWYVVDEYLATFDDPWVSVINKIISDNPVTLSSAFVKNAEPHPHFVVTSSNISLPFSFPASSKNYMRPEVLEAFHSRHQWIHFEKPDYDKSLGRNHPDNAAKPYVMRLETVCDGQVTSSPITYDELIDLLKNQWKTNNEKYVAELEKIATMPDVTVELENATQPVVLGLYGASGMGKTTHINERIIPILEVTRQIHHVTDLDMNPFADPHVYVIDDMLSTDQANLEKYRKFYEKCSSADVIVIADNLMFPTGYDQSYLAGVAEYLCSVTAGTQPFSWKKLWEPRRPLCDVTQLGHESYIRRLGFSDAVYQGRLISTATGNNSTAWITRLGGFFESNSMAPASDGDIMEVAAACLRGSYRNLEKADTVNHDGPWDIDVKIDHPDDVLRVLASPTPDAFVKVTASIVIAFPDYQTLLGHITNELEPDLIYEALARAYRRRAFTARLIVGDRSIRVANGKISGLGTEDENSVTFEDTDDGALVRWANGLFVIQWSDYFARSPSLPDMNPKQLRAFTLARRDFDEVPAVSERRTQYQIAQRRARIQLGLVSSWQSTLEKMQENKALIFVIASLTAAVGAGGAIWLYLRSIKTSEDEEDETSVNYRLPRIARMATSTGIDTESYEERDGASRYQRSVLRRKALNPQTESYEEKDAATHRAVRVMRRGKALPSTASRRETVDLRNKPSGLSMHIEVAVEKTTENLVWLTNGRAQCYGVAYQGRRIICPHHVLHGEMAETTVEFVRDEITYKFAAKTIAQYPSRDVAILEITDKSCPSFKDIRKFFAKQKDLLMHQTAFHFLPKHRTLIAKDVTFQSRMKSALRDAEGSAWAPKDRLYLAESWTTPKLTVPGDCGTLLLAQNPKFENRTIIGMHIAAKTAHTSYAASLCQEDFDLVEEVSPEADEVNVIVIAGKEFIEPARPICNWDRLEPGGYTDIEDSDRLQFIGYSSELFSPSWTRGGDLRPSRISTRLTLENDQGPAPISNRDPRINPAAILAMPRGRDGQPSLGAMQLSHISGQHTSLDPKIYNKSVSAIVDMWMRLPGIRDWRPLTPEETLNGIHEGPYAGYLGPIRGDTSPGLPWKKRGAHQKAHLLVSLNEPGQPIRWDFSDSGVGREMLTSYLDTLSAWRNGMQFQRIIDCNLKVECVPLKKVEAGNCRMFLAESMDAFLAQRSICGFLQILAMKTRWHKHQHHTTGLNPYTEFQELYVNLKRISDLGFDGDYSKFDKRIPAWAWSILEDVLVIVAGQCEFGKRLGYENTIRQFVRSLRTKLYVFEGNIFLSDGDQASGVFPTNIGDSWLNDILVMVAIVSLAEEHKGRPEWKSIMKAGIVDAERLSEYVAWFTHGDDIVFSVHEDLQETFNFEAYRQFLAPHGVKLTLPSKTDGSATLIPIEDLSFIGRTFEFDKGSSRPHGKLRRTAILRMLHWTRDGTWPALAENLEAAGREMRAYPAEEYDEIRYDVETVTHDMGHPFIFPTHRLARLDLIEERDDIPVVRALASRLHSEPVRMEVCLADGDLPCVVEGRTRLAGPGLEAKTDLQVTLRGRSADLSACQAPVTERNEYRSRNRGRIPEPTDHNCQGYEDALPRRAMTRPRRLQNDQEENRDPTHLMEPKQTKPQSPFCATHAHSGLILGQRTEHRHPCSNCRTVFAHEHTIKTEEESKKFPQLCDKCLKANWKIAPEYVELANRVNLQLEMHTLAKPWTTDLSPKMDLPHPDVPGATLTASVAKALTMYHGHPPPSIPEALYATFQCAACPVHMNGVIALYKHAANSHSHLDAINYWPVPPMKLQCGEQRIQLHGPTAVRVRKQMLLDMDVTPESAVAGDSLSTLSSGVDPAAGAALNAAEQPAAMASTSGLEVATATPGMVSGVAAPTESAISLVGPAIPPTMGASTGAQYSSYEVDRAAYEIFTDSLITASQTITGSEIARVSWGDFGPNMMTRLSENTYFSGSTEVQFQFYGTTNTAGSILIYQVDDENDVYNNLSDMLRRPHFLISAAAGTTTQAFIIHQADSTLKSRRTDAPKDGMVPQLRAVMYSPLINTYGTDVTLNLKILTRPGPDFRMWHPKAPGNQETKISTQVMPYKNFIVLDKLGGIGCLDPVEQTVESAIGKKAYSRKVQELPNSTFLTGIDDNDARSGFTGVVNPLMNSLNGTGPQDFVEFGGVLSSDVPYQTSLSTDVANKVLLQTTGSLFNYGSVGAFNLTHVDPYGGFSGLVDSSEYPNVTAATCFESRAKVTHHFETYTFASHEDREAARKNAIWRDRTRTATAGLHTGYTPGLDQSMGALLAKNRSPALVASDLTNFNINSWEDDDWYFPLLRMHADHGNSSWMLRVGNTNYGRVGLMKTGLGLLLYAKGSFRVLNTNGEQIMFHSPLRWTTSNALEFDTNRFETLLVPVTDRIKKHREYVLAHKPEWHKYMVRVNSNRQEDLMCAYLESALAGGLLSGLGSGIQQSAQNRWWDEQFEKNRQHETTMMKTKLDFAREQRAYDQRTRSLEMAQAGSSAGLTRTTKKQPALPSVPEEGSQTPDSTSPKPSDVAPPKPLQFVPGYTGPDGKITGLNNPNPELYHPSNLMQSGSDLATPTQVSNAVNPYTESTKRVAPQ